MRLFASLTSRLVVTAVLLVAVVSLLVGTATTLAVRGQLVDQLDQKVLASVVRVGELGGDPDDDGDGPPTRHLIGNQGPGTLVAFFDSSPAGYVLGERPGDETVLDQEALDALVGVPVDSHVHALQLDDVGSYRLTAVHRVVNGVAGLVVTGLPTADLDATVQSLVLTEGLLILLAVLAAGGIGTVVVRRQLRPLREVAATAHAVAELPLATGAISLEERVPAHLTDERTEVGQVGAAINTMLEHVESSLTARHRSEQQVRQFVADASHELRTPLTTIAGYTELARAHPEDRAAADTALAKVEEESGRMTALVEDLLLLARLDAGRPLARDHVDLSRLLIEAVSDARVLAADHRWRLELPEDSVEVTGDEQRLHQVVSNLLTNVRKYTPPGTTVTVRAHPGGFEVHDDGPGFPPDLVATAFERFARGDVARVRSVPHGADGADGADGESVSYVESGAGLGLSLVQAIATAHGGQVRLRSTPGDTSVSVDLPA